MANAADLHADVMDECTRRLNAEVSCLLGGNLYSPEESEQEEEEEEEEEEEDGEGEDEEREDGDEEGDEDVGRGLGAYAFDRSHNVVISCDRKKIKVWLVEAEHLSAEKPWLEVSSLAPMPADEDAYRSGAKERVYTGNLLGGLTACAHPVCAGKRFTAWKLSTFDLAQICASAS